MTDITVKEFSKTVGLPVNRLIDQLELAGVNKKNENDLISDEEKMQLLDYARNNQSKKKISNESVKDNSQKDLNITKDDTESQENKTVTRRKKVFSKKNNKITEKLDPNKEDSQIENLPEIICEPGRALVAESGSTIVRVNLRKKQKLYINDGTYGTLFDAGTPNIVFPSKMIKDSSNKIISKKLTAFDFYGPTCDSMDYMKGPFLLPNNIKENDYIELGQLGSYGLTFRTQFNGFYSDEIYEVEDSPIMSLYDKGTSKATLVA